MIKIFGQVVYCEEKKTKKGKTIYIVVVVGSSGVLELVSMQPVAVSDKQVVIPVRASVYNEKVSYFVEMGD